MFWGAFSTAPHNRFDRRLSLWTLFPGTIIDFLSRGSGKKGGRTRRWGDKRERRGAIQKPSKTVGKHQWELCTSRSISPSLPWVVTGSKLLTSVHLHLPLPAVPRPLLNNFYRMIQISMLQSKGAILLIRILLRLECGFLGPKVIRGMSWD